jgi:Protein of unknown function with HXXEE motif
MTRLKTTFLALIGVQTAHSVEEYLGRLWEVFPPARFVTGLLAEDRRVGFIVINIALFIFGVCSFIWPVRRNWPSASVIACVWIVIELINGAGHILWSLQARGYTPGVITAPLLLILALVLGWELKKEAATFSSAASSE